MKLKKILSLLSAVTISVSCFAGLATTATANVDAPKWVTTVTKITDWSTAPYTTYQSEFDYEGYTTYWIDFQLTGVLLEGNLPSGKGAKWTGYSITSETTLLKMSGDEYSENRTIVKPATGRSLLPITPGDVITITEGSEYLIPASALLANTMNYPNRNTPAGGTNHTRDMTTPILMSYIACIPDDATITLDMLNTYQAGNNPLKTVVAADRFESEAVKTGEDIAFTDIAMDSITLPPETAAVTGVTVSAADTTLTKDSDESENLTANVTVTGEPDYTVAWSIVEGDEYVTLGTPSGANNKNVTVSIKSGADLSEARTVKIKAAAGGKDNTITLTIDAVAPVDPEVTSVTISPDSTTLTKGTKNSEALTAVVGTQGEPDYTVDWSIVEGDEYVTLGGATGEKGINNTVSIKEGANLLEQRTAVIKAAAGGEFDTITVTISALPEIDIVYANTGDRFYDGDTGYVWKVDVSNRFRNEKVEVKFSAEGETPITRLLPLNLVEIYNDFRFDIVLNTSKPGVTIEVYKKIN